MGAGCICTKNTISDNLEKVFESQNIQSEVQIKDKISCGNESNKFITHTNKIKSNALSSQNSLKLSKFKMSIENIGKETSIGNFNSIIGQKFLNFSNSNPYELKEVINKENLIEEGPIQFKNNNIYWGNWNANSEMEGYGKLYLPEEKVFVEGLWNKGKLNQGRIIDDEGIYEGEIKNSLPHGKGKMTYTDGIIYKGNFENGLKEGDGCLFFPDKSKYSGEFKNDVISGRGEFIWNSGYEYKGEFKNGYFEGNGTLKDPNGSSYNGDFKNGIYHGRGQFIWGSGSNESYYGSYLFGKKEGHGVYTFGDGSIYDGSFKDNKPHGQGQVETINKVYKSFWRYGKISEDPIVDIKGNSKENYPLDLNIKIEDIDYKNIKYLNFEHFSDNKNGGYNSVILNNDNNKEILQLIPKENIRESLFDEY